MQEDKRYDKQDDRTLVYDPDNKQLAETLVGTHYPWCNAYGQCKQESNAKPFNDDSRCLIMYVANKKVSSNVQYN